MQQTQPATGELLTRREVMERLGIRSPTTIRNWTQKLGFPRPIQITERSKVFRWDEIVAWLDARPSAVAPAGRDYQRGVE
jgi:predicted DNA-binding transcriptional regulator AlpA